MKVAVFGEGMLELVRDRARASCWTMGSGGDTLNTAVHLARFGLDVSFVTALGTDSFSDQLTDAWRSEGLDVGSVVAFPDRLPGLYAVETDASGERSFTYWREQSAARHVFEHPQFSEIYAKLKDVDLLFYSLISLAILPEPHRRLLWELCDHVRARGGRVAFDSNYRPRLWRDVTAARSSAVEARRRCDIGLPTLPDEQALGSGGDIEAIAASWRADEVAEVVIKAGSSSCLVSAPNILAKVPPLENVAIVNTSGAGDAFNGGYLAARLAGQEPIAAAHAGHRLAAWVVALPGAIPRHDANAPYSELIA